VGHLSFARIQAEQQIAMTDTHDIRLFSRERRIGDRIWVVDVSREARGFVVQKVHSDDSPEKNHADRHAFGDLAAAFDHGFALAESSVP
jgi:hypothetical protein